MGIVIIDGTEVEVGEHERLNGIQAARRAGVEIPHYCWHPGLSVVASCRMCLVETGTRGPDGKVTMLPKLVPACQTPAKDGTIFITDNEKVRNARAMVEEDLLLDHPIDCPICDKAGECLLQDYHFEHGREQRRADIKPFTSRRREMGSTVTLFVDRCVMCTRCVRFTREATGTGELMVINRGSHEEIDVFPGYPLENKLSGNVVDLCPVGALCDKDFLYKQRVWFMKKHQGVCASCSTGCSVWIEENQDTVYRLKPRENQSINQWWICDEGRYNYGYIHEPRRQVEPRRREGSSYINVEWPQVPRELEERISKVVRDGGRLAVVISPFQTVEEAYLLCKLAKQLDSHAYLAVGPVPIEDSDEKFKNGFIIHAEKCPNRKGVEAVIAHFGDNGAKSWDDFLAELDAGAFGAVWVAAGYRQPWIDDDTNDRFNGVGLIIVQDLFESPLWLRATYQLPGGGYAERSGSYVNYADRLQSFKWAVRPPAGAKVEGHLYWQMLGMRGMYNAREVLNDVAGAIPYFAMAMDPVPPTGVDLKLNQLAEQQVETSAS